MNKKHRTNVLFSAYFSRDFSLTSLWVVLMRNNTTMTWKLYFKKIYVMIKYRFDDKLTKAYKEQQLWFVTSLPLSFQDFVGDIELQETIRSLEINYKLSQNIHLALDRSLHKFETYNWNRRASSELREVFNYKFIGKNSIEAVSFTENSFQDFFHLWNYKAIYNELLSNVNEKRNWYSYKRSVSDNKHIRGYISFLYIVSKQKLFRCIDPNTENLDIVDAWNLHKFIWWDAHIILPLDEWYYRWNTNRSPSSPEEQSRMKRNSFRLEKEPIQQIKEFWEDIEELRRKYPYHSVWFIGEISEQRLWDNTTKSIEVINKKNYRIVKPTITKSGTDKSVEQDVDKYWEITIKKHILKWTRVRELYYTPTYKVLKTEQQQV